MFFYDLNKIIEKKIIKYSSGFQNKKINILIAYSGGVDSSVLLHVVNLLSLKMNIDYDFVYIDHGMNVNSKHIIRIGNQFASMNNKNFICHRIKEKPNNNIESFFRNYRYNYFNNLKKKNKYDFVFTAHHYDDQVETIYMRTKGNYDWTNLLGIREIKDSVRRPFLNVKKSMLINYAINNNIFWVFDNSNKNNAFFRNNVRNLKLKKHSMVYRNLLFFLSRYSQFNFFLFKKRFNNFKDKIIIDNNDFILLKKKPFLQLHKHYKKIFLQSILKKYNNNNYLIMKKSKWHELWNYLEIDKNLKDFDLNKRITINNSKDLIIVKSKKKYKKKVDLKHSTIWNNYIFKIKKTNCLEGFDLDKNSIYIKEEIFKKGLFLRNWNHGDFYLDSKNNKRKVSRLFSKNKFNNYRKMSFPLIVYSNNKVLWVPGFSNSFMKKLYLPNNNCIKISKEILN